MCPAPRRVAMTLTGGHYILCVMAPAYAQSPDEPRRVEIHLGTRCNSRCAFCMSSVPRDQREPWAVPERVRAELRHYYKRGCRAAGFLGGEPTAYPGLPACIAYARKLGYARISICTNGLRFSDAGFCRELVDAGLTRVTLSVHSHLARVEDRLITRVRGALARKVRAVRNLVALRDQGRLPGNIALNPVLCRPNLEGLEGYADFFGGLGVDDIRFNYIWPHGEARGERAWVPSLREAMPRVVRLILRNEKGSRRRLSFGGVPKCALLLAGVSPRLLEHLAARYFDEAGFDPGNDVTMAGQAGGREERFVWQERKKDVLKVQAPGCRNCRHQDRCEGVWASYADIYGFGELTPL